MLCSLMGVSDRCEVRNQRAAVDGSEGRLCREGKDLHWRRYFSKGNMVVLQPTKLGTSRVGFNLKRGRARRALSLLGDNNSKLNLQLAESLLTISAEEFTKKWNFDPIREVPLRDGRYQWTTTDPTASRPPNAAEDVAHERPRTCFLASANDPPPPAGDPSRDTCVTQGAARATNICGTAAGGGDHHLHRLRTCGTGTGEQPVADPGVSGSERVGTLQTDDQRVETNPQRVENDRQATENVTRNEDDSQAGVRLPEAAASGSRAESEAVVAERGGGRPAAAAPRDSPRSDPHDVVQDDPHIAPVDDSHAPTLRQTCITEYVRPRKRATATTREPHLQHQTHSKKRPASSLQDHLHQPPHKKVLLQLRA